MQKKLFWVSVTAIIYGTLLPFEFSLDWLSAREKYLDAFGIFNWAAFDFSTPDMIQNILLFIPFGLFISAYCKQGFGAVLWGALFSTLIEIFQGWSESRHPGIHDVMMNSLGAWIGFFFYPILTTITNNILAHINKSWPQIPNPNLRHIGFMLILAIAVHWQPFDFTMDFGNISANIKWLIKKRFIGHHPGDGQLFGFWLISTLLILQLFNPCRRHDRLLLMSGLLTLSVFLELGQMILSSRVPSINDIFICISAILFGGLLNLFSNTSIGLFSKIIALLSFSISVLIDWASPFIFNQPFQFNWIPFVNVFMQTDFHQFASEIEILVFFMAVGSFLSFNFNSKQRIYISFFLTILIFGMEIMQGFSERYGSTNEVLSTALGLYLGIQLTNSIHKKQTNE